MKHVLCSVYVVQVDCPLTGVAGWSKVLLFGFVNKRLLIVV